MMKTSEPLAARGDGHNVPDLFEGHLALTDDSLQTVQQVVGAVLARVRHVVRCLTTDTDTLTDAVGAHTKQLDPIDVKSLKTGLAK